MVVFPLYAVKKILYSKKIMPVTHQQIQAEEARTGIKQIAMRREYTFD